MARLLNDWIDSFVEYTEYLPSPKIFRKWGAISAVAGALERKVWIKSQRSELYPHLYVILVAPPGIGKTEITKLVEALWRKVDFLKVAPKVMSKASLIDALAAAEREKTVLPPIGQMNGAPVETLFLKFNSLLINAGELASLIPTYDFDFMGALTDLYDGNFYEERKRSSRIHHSIKKPQLNLIGACTPGYLTTTLPEAAWDQGFLSRTLLVYSEARQIRDVFDETVGSPEVYPALESDMKDIANMAGVMMWDEDAKDAVRQWIMKGGPPQPTHPRLTHYLTRRGVHLLKLTMISAVSRSADRVIRLPDYQRALDWLLEMEDALPDIFRAIGSKGDKRTIDDAWHWIYEYHVKTKKPMLRHRLVNFLTERVPGYSVLRILELMVEGDLIQECFSDEGMPAYTPIKAPTLY